MKGLKNHRILLRKNPVSLGFIKNVDLYNLGEYPAIKHGKSFVFGELYDINKKNLKRIDEFEEFDKRDKNSVYKRVKTQIIIINNKIEEAWCYFYNKPVKENKKLKIHDYRRLMLERTSKHIWIVVKNRKIRKHAKVCKYMLTNLSIKPLKVCRIKLTKLKKLDRLNKRYIRITTYAKKYRHEIPIETYISIPLKLKMGGKIWKH